MVGVEIRLIIEHHMHKWNLRIFEPQLRVLNWKGNWEKGLIWFNLAKSEKTLKFNNDFKQIVKLEVDEDINWRRN
jgi:hypothetical protein